eukprot:TRINITY_DN5458_c1_g1_i2.p1 TRINITY_DN5458_c1_g1~~TRINITY_DN5458_c1_g1_i2.p1  ORF type:complete len:125 (+),score=8.51 TRINITY_DN5458_c1_g1_i2:973-1347(+)
MTNIRSCCFASLRKATRSCTTRHPTQNVVSYSHLSPIYQTFISNLATECIPKHVLEASTHPKWREAMKEEMTTLATNHMWNLTALLEGKRIVGCKWVFTLKYNPDGTISRSKTCCKRIYSIIWG